MITKATRARHVLEGITEGYGVEDIALMQGIDIAAVRFEVEQLRQSGQLKCIFPARKGAVSSTGLTTEQEKA
jgi:hypothetical protein